jgi:hypothetical protein
MGHRKKAVQTSSFKLSLSQYLFNTEKGTVFTKKLKELMANVIKPFSS